MTDIGPSDWFSHLVWRVIKGLAWGFGIGAGLTIGLVLVNGLAYGKW